MIVDRWDDALRRSEELFRAVSEMTSDYAFSVRVETDGSFTYEWITGGFERVTGYRPEEQKPWLELIHPEDRARMMEAVDRLMATGDSATYNLRLVTKSGDTKYVRVWASAIREEEHVVRIIGAASDLTRQTTLERELRQAMSAMQQLDEQRARLLTHLVKAKEEERARVASDIHDDSVQVMTSTAIQLERLAKRTTDPDVARTAEQLEERVRDAIGRLRRMVFELRPPTLELEGLSSALRLYLEEFALTSGIDYELSSDLEPEPDTATRVVFYRIAQEALTNVRKHSGAGKVGVRLARTDGAIEMVVSDDGSGFEVTGGPSEPGHLGLTEMRERAESAGGSLAIDAAPGNGVSIRVRLPESQP